MKSVKPEGMSGIHGEKLKLGICVWFN